jgi:hypothetical protein
VTDVGVAEVIALAVLVILSAVVLTLTWRAMRWSLTMRRVLLFRQAIAEIAARADALLGGICERVDKVRRSVEAGGDLIPELTPAWAQASALAGEARAIRGPADTAAIVTGIADELDRAARAIEMVEHGCTILGLDGGRQHDPEAQTAIKRGYLNLLHARENIAQHAAAAAALPVAVPRIGRHAAE